MGSKCAHLKFSSAHLASSSREHHIEMCVDRIICCQKLNPTWDYSLKRYLIFLFFFFSDKITKTKIIYLYRNMVTILFKAVFRLFFKPLKVPKIEKVTNLGYISFNKVIPDLFF